MPHTTRRRSGPSAATVREVWAELSATMRVLRTSANLSLRQVEDRSGVGRGTLSQFETAKARPNRSIVEWYDTALGGDGLLLSLYAEARGAHGPSTARSWTLVRQPGDAMQVIEATLPFGTLVRPGAAVTARWTLSNVGTVPWRARRLERIGARAGMRLIRSAPGVQLRDCDPGGSVECSVELVVPELSATYAAGWQMADTQGRVILPYDAALSVQLVVHTD